MSFKTFIMQVYREVKRLCGEGYRLVIRDIPGNNGVTYKGIIIRSEGETFDFAACMESHYRRYRDEGISIQSAAEAVYRAFVRNRAFGDLREGMDRLEKIKDKVICCLVSGKRNKALLMDIPWVPFCGLAVVFRVLLKEDREGTMSFLIRNEHMWMWGTDVGGLCELARENTPRLRPYTFRPIVEVIKERNGEAVPDGEEDCPMYVLSNERGIYGAAAVLYDNVLRDVSERLGADLVIVPLSIHHTVVIPDGKGPGMEELGEIVSVIIDTMMPEEAMLSDNLYHYSRKTGTVTVAVEYEAGLDSWEPDWQEYWGYKG